MTKFPELWSFFMFFFLNDEFGNFIFTPKGGHYIHYFNHTKN